MPRTQHDPRRPEPARFVAVYVNWYVCNGAVLLPAFGDVRADAAARELVGELFPGRTVEQLRIDAIAAGPGAKSTAARSSSPSSGRAVEPYTPQSTWTSLTSGKGQPSSPGGARSVPGV